VADITHAEVELHRAETGGFFVPEVRVGDRVKSSQLLGHVQSPIGGERLCELRARRPGVVMTVRAWPMVHAQELVLRLAALREA
jgi:predicted deacylase